MMRAFRLTATLLCVLVAGLFGALEATAYRAPLKSLSGTEELLETGSMPPLETEKQIEGACGLAVNPVAHDLYVADFQHRAIHSFTGAGIYQSSFFLAGGDPTPVDEPIRKLNSVCGLAIDSAGTIYGNEFHKRVVRLPGETLIDPGPATGIAVATDGDLYVDDRTYVAVYDAPVEPGEVAASKIGVGNLGDAYGVAVDSKTGRVYVADAAKEVVKVFEPSINPSTPVGTIEPPAAKSSFHSLANTSLAVDESSTEGEGHLLVVDDLEPGFIFPEAAIYEYAADGTYRDRLQVRTVVGFPGEPRGGPIFSEPPGIAVNQNSGTLFVTTGNTALSNVVAYGPFEKEAPSPLSGATDAAAASLRAKQAIPGSSAGGASASVTEQRRGVRVSFDGKLTPHVLPRHGTAPVGIVVDSRISATGGQDPPQLRRITIAINRNGHFTSAGLPACRLDQIQPSTTDGALAACRDSLVGEGSFSANVKLPQQSPFPSAGKVLAFNGKINGRPAILAHIYGTQPAPTSTVLPFLLRKSHGTYGTTLEASLPQATGNWGYVTGLRMNLRRHFTYRGHSRSFLSAGCPAPAGFPSAAFPLAKTSFNFAGNLTLDAVLNRTCRARG